MIWGTNHWTWDNGPGEYCKGQGIIIIIKIEKQEIIPKIMGKKKEKNYSDELSLPFVCLHEKLGGESIIVGWT